MTGVGGRKGKLNLAMAHMSKLRERNQPYSPPSQTKPHHGGTSLQNEMLNLTIIINASLPGLPLE